MHGAARKGRKQIPCFDVTIVQCKARDFNLTLCIKGQPKALE
jgi:hypothetical protein